MSTKRLKMTRPDKFDLNDRIYRPPLRPLPCEYPDRRIALKLMPHYEHLVLNQEETGACTGYGLAACINYQLWFGVLVKPMLDKAGSGLALTEYNDEALENQIEQIATSPAAEAIRDRRVSPWMLYNLAQLYDKWDGEDYSGSSCRGALRGWHHNGVCRMSTWGEDNSPKDEITWRSEAPMTTLGAYYRVNTQSVPDIQAAICEVHAIFASAKVHTGWDKLEYGDDIIPNIPNMPGVKANGGHAFAIVGYDDAGLIIQNSWGPEWGYNGFARLGYDDWLTHGMDAWVAALGAPRSGVLSPSGQTSYSLLANPELVSSQDTSSADRRFHSTGPWSESEAYEHALVLGNEGRAVSRSVTTRKGREQVRRVAEHNILSWCGKDPKFRDIVLLPIGGLLSEADTINRIRRIGPCFLANGIYPLFVTWRLGLLQTIEYQFARAEDAGDLPMKPATHMIASREDEARDFTIETYASSSAIRPLWTEYKFNGDKAADGQGGARLMVNSIINLKERYPDVRIHIAAYSVAALLAGHIMEDFRNPNHPIELSSLYLLAPACSVEFATKKYLDLVDKGLLEFKRIRLEVLSEANELSDNVANQYKKSLLYLISRAMEVKRSEPLMGLRANLIELEAGRHWANDPARLNFGDGEAKENQKKTYYEHWSGLNTYVVTDSSVSTAKPDSEGHMNVFPANHLSFLYSMDTMRRILSLILEGKDPIMPGSLV